MDDQNKSPDKATEKTQEQLEVVFACINAAAMFLILAGILLLIRPDLLQNWIGVGPNEAKIGAGILIFIGFGDFIAARLLFQNRKAK